MSKDPDLFKFEVNFFKVLQEISKKTIIFLQVPDTLVSDYEFDSPTLFSSDSTTGELYIKTNLCLEAIEEVFEYFEQQEHDHLFPVATLKSITSRNKTHCRVLYTSTECSQKWHEPNRSNKAIQKFIRNGNMLSLIKTTWDGLTSKLHAKEIIKHKNLKNAIETHKKSSQLMKRKSIITAMNSKAYRQLFQISAEDSNLTEVACTIPFLERKMMYLIGLFEKFYLKSPNLKVLTFDADWIRDSFGKLYLLRVKSYRIAEIDALRPTITLFHVPKVSVNEFVLAKPRTSISLKKKVVSKKHLSKSETQLIIQTKNHLD